MSFAIELSATARRRLLECGHKKVAALAAQQLHSLESGARREKLVTGPLVDRMYWEFRVEQPPLSFRIGVCFVYLPDERTIEVLDFGIQREGIARWHEVEDVCKPRLA